MGAPEARLRAAMLPGCGEDGTRPSAAAAGVEPMRNRARSAAAGDDPVTSEPREAGLINRSNIVTVRIPTQGYSTINGRGR